MHGATIKKGDIFFHIKQTGRAPRTADSNAKFCLRKMQSEGNNIPVGHPSYTSAYESMHLRPHIM
jgi:hypothetical protein